MDALRASRRPCEEQQQGRKKTEEDEKVEEDDGDVRDENEAEEGDLTSSSNEPVSKMPDMLCPPMSKSAKYCTLQVPP
eukprot:8662205-Pyramimonas_sp.AAC.1